MGHKESRDGVDSMSGTPKTIRKIQENAYMNISYKWVFVFVIWAVVTLLLVIPITMLESSTLIKIILTALILMWWGIYFKCFRSSDVVNRTLLIIKYLFKSATGQTVIAKYNVPPEFLHSVVPVKDVHAGGIVQFTGDEYGQLFRLDPPRISEDELASHIKRVELVVNSLHGEMMIKTIVCSRTDISEGLQQDILESTKGKTAPQKEHLYALYKDISENNADIIDWQFYVYVGVGKQESLEHARIALGAQLPGLLKYFHRAGCHCVPVANVDDVALVYRQLFVQNKIVR